MRGDILLYRTGGSLQDRVVCAYTGGPYCHCEIDLGDGTALGAHSEDGIKCRPTRLLDRIVVVSLQGATSSERIELAIGWALQHVGEPFSWAGIADLVVPAWLSTWVFGRRSAYHCSNLVARYLEIAGGLDLSRMGRGAMLLSPNDIARAAGLLPELRGLRRVWVVRIVASLLAILPLRAPGFRAHHDAPDKSTPCG